MTDTSGEAERGEVQSMASGPPAGAAQVRLRTCATFQSVSVTGKDLCSPRTGTIEGRAGLAVQAQLLGGAAAGVEPPQIEGRGGGRE